MSDDKHCNIFIDFFSLEIIQLGIFFRQVLFFFARNMKP